MTIKDGTRLETVPGYIVVDIGGQKTQYPIQLTLANIPALTYEQVGAIKTLANMFADLTKKLIELELLDPEFTGENGYNLAAIIETIEGIGGDYGEPDLTVT